jgi:excisionase family DNA binding protein
MSWLERRHVVKPVASNSSGEGTVDIGYVGSETSLLTPAQVAAMLYVDPKTVSRWATAGKLGSIRTPGGHRRFLRSEIVAMVAAGHHQDARDRTGSEAGGCVNPTGARP